VGDRVITAVELRLYNAAATSWTLLPNFITLNADEKYNDISAIQLDYPLDDDTSQNITGAKTLGLAEGSLLGMVLIYDDGTYTEPERYVIDSANDKKVFDGKRVRSLTGRSTLGVYLEDCQVYPSNWPVTAPAGHEFVNATAGTIWRTLIQRAQDRAAATSSTAGIVNVVETGFSGTNDSTGAAWSLTLGDQQFDNGTSYLQIAQDQMSRGIVDMRLEGWTLFVQNGGTYGNHVPIGVVEIRPARNATDMTKSSDATDSASTILMSGDEGTAIERHSSGAQTILGRRRERSVAQGGIADSGTLTILADAELTMRGRVASEETVGVALTDISPWKDFSPADWVWVRFDTDSDPLERRVRQIALSVDSNRTLSIGITLNDILYENDVKLQRKVDGYAGSGSSYGSTPNNPDTSIPNAPTLVSGGVTSATFVDSQGNYVAAVTATWTPPTTNVGGSTITDLDGYEVQWQYVGDTNWSMSLPSDTNIFSWSPLAPGRQINVRVRTVDNSTNRSGWSTTITHTVAVDVTAPPKPSAPVVSAAYAAVAVKWDGLGDNSGTPVAMPNDLDRLEIWQSTTSGFTIGAGGSTLAGTLFDAGTYFVQGAFGTPLFIKTRAIDKAGNISATSSQGSATPSKIQTGQVDPNAIVSDSLPPASSPTPTSLPGIGSFIVKWTPVTNHDLVYYEVHVSATSGFTATFNSSTTAVGTATGTQFIVRQLPGTAPAPGAPDPRILDYNTTYYAKVIAFDVDGAAAPSAQVDCVLFQVTGIDLAADSVTAENIVANTLTGDLFAANVIMGGTFKTADAGQRVEFGIDGIKGYKSTGDLMVSFPTTDGEEALYDGEMIARGLTVTGGSSFQSDENEVTADATLTLMRGIVSPSASPTLDVGYDTAQVSTTSLSAAVKTNNDPSWGLGGPFDLVPSEISHIEWRADTGYNCFAMYQIRPTGTRVWYIKTDGTPKDVTGGGAYYNDFKNWEIWSATNMLTNSDPTKIGHYVIFRYLPSGSGNVYYVSSPLGINRYSRQNGVAPPSMGNNGNDIFVAEVISSTHLNMRYYIPDGSGGNMPAPITAYESPAGYNANVGLCQTLYSPTGFDIGSPRYVTAERGNNANNRLVYTSGTNLPSIYPGGTTAGVSAGQGWGSSAVNAEQFEAPTSNRRGITWDGTQFWSFHSDGFLYKHTSERWDPATTSSLYWGKVTFYDSDATGSTHETAPGPAKSYTAKRRSKNNFTPPAIPDNGGTDDPDQVKLYMARGATAPVNTAYHLQYTGSAATSFTTMATATANPPTSGNFPSATPALLRNDNDELVISGDGTATFKQIFQGSTGATNEVLANPPYYYAWVDSGQPAGANNTSTNVTSYTLDTTPSTSGITQSGGTFTVPRAGRYRLVGQLYWPIQASPAGKRICSWALVSPLTTLVSHTATPSAITECVNHVNKTVRLAAGAQLIFRFTQTSGIVGGLAPLTTSKDLSFITIDYVGP
jgi:hypothetical protein